MQARTQRKHIISETALIAAPPKDVYAVFADYHVGHPAILPKAFTRLDVEKGGTGAGTIIRCQMRVWGRTQTFRAVITEPEPGRVLVETGLDESKLVTTFIIDPAPRGSQVTITTELPVRTGLIGKIEQFLFTRILRPIYVEEFAILANYVAKPRQRIAAAS